MPLENSDLGRQFSGSCCEAVEQELGGAGSESLFLWASLWNAQNRFCLFKSPSSYNIELFLIVNWPDVEKDCSLDF